MGLWSGTARGRTVLVVGIMMMLLFAGCVAKKDDDERVLKSFSRASASSGDEEILFTVGPDVDEIKLTFSTRPKNDNNNIPGCGQWCDFGNNDEPDPSGKVAVFLVNPDDDPAATMTLAYDESEQSVIEYPQRGRWAVVIDYQGGYDGPASMAVTTPAATGGGVTVDGSVWDIIGVVIAITGFVGAAILYRRRGAFLRRELHRIDATYRTLGDDMDECRTNLLDLREQIKDMLLKRKIEENQYIILEKRIDQYLADLDQPGNRHAAPAVPADAKPRGVDRIRRSKS